MEFLCLRMRKSVQTTGQEKDSFDLVKQEETSRSDGSIVVLRRGDGEAKPR